MTSKTFLVEVTTFDGEREYLQRTLVIAKDEAEACVEGCHQMAHGELEAGDGGFYDEAGGGHFIKARGASEVAPEHLPILQHYLYGAPLPGQSDGWHVTWEIDLDKSDADTSREAGMVAGRIAASQFMRLVDWHRRDDVTKPALVINGQLIDFEQDQ